MAQQRPKRLPTDFFDRLLSNQTDDQINDLLTSLVDEQISPNAVPEPDFAPLHDEPPVHTVRRDFHRDKIEDSIVTRDEELDAVPLEEDQESALDELIPRTNTMHGAPEAPAAPPTPEYEETPQAPPAAIQFPGADTLEVPQELIEDEAQPAGTPQPEMPDVPLVPDVPPVPGETTGSGIVGAPPPGVHGAPEKWPAEETPAVPEVPVQEPAAPAFGMGDEPESDIAPDVPFSETAAAAFGAAVDESEKIDIAHDFSAPEAVETPPAETESFTPVMPLPEHDELVRARMTARWESPKRKAKLPKLAKASKPIVVPPPKPDTISDILGEMDRAEKGFKFTKLSRAALMFLLPAFIAFSLFSWYPMIKGLIISFFNYQPMGETTFVGVQNYVTAFHDIMFWKTLLHAGGFCLLVLLLGFWLPIFLSIFINELRVGKGMFKFLFFLPFLMPTVPAAILWKWIMDQGYGLLNAVLSVLPLADPHVGWLTNPHLALLSIVIVYIWKNTGWAILIYSSAIVNIDETMYEEAEIHGATLWQKIRFITLPAIRGVIAVMLIITIINTIQLFTEVYIMTNGGPMNTTEMIATYIYKQAFFYMDIGYASALSMLMLLMLLVITMFRLKRLNPEEG